MKTVSASLLLGLMASAQSAEPVALPPHFEACATLSRDAERLACYDKAVALTRAGADSVAAPSAENMFGANQAIATPAANQPVKREELAQISGKVTSLSRTGDGIMLLELDNGQVWRQQDSAVKLLINSGDTVTIVRAALGTFRIADKTGRFARFRRVR
jgi:hypothetical protein